MAPPENLPTRVRIAFASVPTVTEKKMFGSLGFMVRGKLCIGAREERIMVRIDPAFHEAALEREGCQSVVMKGRETKGYVYVTAGAVKTKRALMFWLNRALAYNEKITS